MYLPCRACRTDACRADALMCVHHALSLMRVHHALSLKVSCAAGTVTAVPPSSCGGVPACFEVADAKSSILLKVPHLLQCLRTHIEHAYTYTSAHAQCHVHTPHASTLQCAPPTVPSLTNPSVLPYQPQTASEEDCASWVAFLNKLKASLSALRSVSRRCSLPAGGTAAVVAAAVLADVEGDSALGAGQASPALPDRSMHGTRIAGPGPKSPFLRVKHHSRVCGLFPLLLCLLCTLFRVV